MCALHCVILIVWVTKFSCNSIMCGYILYKNWKLNFILSFSTSATILSKVRRIPSSRWRRKNVYTVKYRTNIFHSCHSRGEKTQIFFKLLLLIGYSSTFIPCCAEGSAFIISVSTSDQTRKFLSSAVPKQRKQPCKPTTVQLWLIPT